MISFNCKLLYTGVFLLSSYSLQAFAKETDGGNPSQSLLSRMHQFTHNLTILPDGKNKDCKEKFFPTEKKDQGVYRMVDADQVAADIKKDPIIRLSIDKDAVLPKDFPVEYQKAVKDHGLSMYLIWDNDNSYWSLIGADSLNGDDVGFTHGLEIGLQKKNFITPGMVISANYRSRLYTRRVDTPTSDIPEGMSPQFFSEENVLRLMLESPSVRIGFFDAYIKGGGGFVEVTSKDSGNLLHATKQQRSFHHLLNEISPGYADKWVNVETPFATKDKDGNIIYVDTIKKPFLEFYFGLRKILSTKDGRCTLKMQSEAGGLRTQMAGASYKSIDSEIKFSYQMKSGKKPYLKIENENDHFRQGTYLASKRSTQAFEVGVEGKHWDVGTGVYQTKGDPIEYVQYDVTALDGEKKSFDPMTRLFFNYHF